MTQIKDDNGNWVVVAGGQRTWVGTKAALQTALNNDEIPNGTPIMVTDDYAEGTEIVDAVENGNMKAVTSNAVYDALMNITTLTPTKTANVGTVFETEFLRIGRLVSVNINIIANSGVLFTGLPKPRMRQTFTVNGYNEQDKALRLIVKTDGSIETDNASAITDQNIGGHIVYITADN